MRREHVVAFMVLAWSGSARASNEDAAIERASADLKCDDLRMMHAKNQYAFVGCGKRRLYECAGGKCEDVTHRTQPDPSMSKVACAALVTTGVAAVAGCACLAIASNGNTPTFPVVTPDATRGVCMDE